VGGLSLHSVGVGVCAIFNSFGFVRCCFWQFLLFCGFCPSGFFLPLVFV
jgi:hypothetical protein